MMTAAPAAKSDGDVDGGLVETATALAEGMTVMLMAAQWRRRRPLAEGVTVVLMAGAAESGDGWATAGGLESPAWLIRWIRSGA